MSNTVLKKMVVKASEDHPLTSDIAYEATYDIYTGKTTVVNGSGAREIMMDFGANGYELPSGYTPVTVLIGREGKEIGRIRGSAEWDSQDVIEYMYKIKAEHG